MNGYPEWTPASEKPNQFGWYLATTDNGGVDVLLYDIIAGKWSRGDEDHSITAWMPLPPAYEPPRFGWHNAEDDPPKRDGLYIIGLGAVGGYPYGFSRFERERWRASIPPKWWSHIEPTPE